MVSCVSFYGVIRLVVLVVIERTSQRFGGGGAQPAEAKRAAGESRGNLPASLRGDLTLERAVQVMMRGASVRLSELGQGDDSGRASGEEAAAANGAASDDAIAAAAALRRSVLPMPSAARGSSLSIGRSNRASSLFSPQRGHGAGHGAGYPGSHTWPYRGAA